MVHILYTIDHEVTVVVHFLETWTVSSGAAISTVFTPDGWENYRITMERSGNELREFAGLLEWMAVVTVQLKPFVRQIWAAIYAKGPDEHTVYEQQVHVALVWVAALVEDRTHMHAIRHFNPPALQAVVVCDASPFGGGAALYFLNPAMQINLDTLAAATPWVWAARRWVRHDEDVAQGWIGEPGSQARWEAYAAVAVIRLWSKVIFAASGGLTVVGDALGVLFGASALHSKDSHINKLFMELALILAPTGRCVEAIHVWSEDNELADKLSRLTGESEDEIPTSLLQVSRTVWSATTDWKIVNQL